MNKQGFGKTLSELDFVALKRGKHHGFNAAYQLYADHVYSLCVHILGNEQTAADIMQTVFETLLIKSSSLQKCESLGAWLKQCSINACMGYFRQIKQEHLFFEHNTSTLSVAGKSDSCENANFVIDNSFEENSISNNVNNENAIPINSLLKRLPTTARSVVYLHAAQGLKHNEIAPSLDIEESNSRQLYSRAIKQLRLWIGKAG